MWPTILRKDAEFLKWSESERERKEGGKEERKEKFGQHQLTTTTTAIFLRGYSTTYFAYIIYSSL